MLLIAGLDNIKDGHINHQMIKIKMFNYINSITSLIKQPRLVLNQFSSGSKCFSNRIAGVYIILCLENNFILQPGEFLRGI